LYDPERRHASHFLSRSPPPKADEEACHQQERKEKRPRSTNVSAEGPPERASKTAYQICAAPAGRFRGRGPPRSGEPDNSGRDRGNLAPQRAQLDQLVEELGIDPRRPDKWRRAFYELATLHHGVGVISWVQPRGTNRRAAKWTDEHDINLHLLVLEETKSGVKPSRALLNIASDPKKWGKLAPQKVNSRSEKSDNELRYQTLRKRWSMVQKTSILEKVLQRAFGASADQQLPARTPLVGKI
jgi:hypothetical protein